MFCTNSNGRNNLKRSFDLYTDHQRPSTLRNNHTEETIYFSTYKCSSAFIVPDSSMQKANTFPRLQAKDFPAKDFPAKALDRRGII